MMKHDPRLPRWSTRLAIALAAVLLAGLSACDSKEKTNPTGPREKTVPVRVTEVRLDTLRETVRGIGTLQAAETVEIKPEIDGDHGSRRPGGSKHPRQAVLEAGDFAGAEAGQGVEDAVDEVLEGLGGVGEVGALGAGDFAAGLLDRDVPPDQFDQHVLDGQRKRRPAQGRLQGRECVVQSAGVDRRDGGGARADHIRVTGVRRIALPPVPIH
ncbi:MAG: hypothetical protein KAY37_13475 [Phycisphaerae bacterium]|nr:hypothetical protein [Phycisphaerae bacterium]